ncbi:6855_t:CDS:2 [Funneliformis geosporum]|nr:6855_t:CDS:2 [Funneliformis geosporum]
MSEKGVETDDESSLYTEENDRQEIKDIVFSPNMKYMVTSDDTSLVMWTVELDNNKIKKYKKYKDYQNYWDDSPSLLRLSNNKLLIMAYVYDGDYYYLNILDMEIQEYIKINPSYGNFLQFLPNGNLLLLQAQYIYVFTETSLKDSPCTYTSRFQLGMVDIRRGLKSVDIRMDLKVADMQKIIQMEQISGQIFFTLKDSVMIIQINTAKWTIENKYILPGSYNWIGAVNNDKSLFAIYLKQAETPFLCVYSMKNGILISSRQVKFEGNDIKIRFIESNNIEVLMLYSLDIKNEEIKYVVTNPYELSYTCEYKYDIKKYLPNGIYEITKSPTSRYNVAIFTQLIGFIIPDENDEIIKKLYDNIYIAADKNDKMIIDFYDDILLIPDKNNEIIKKPHYKSKPSIYSRFKDIRDSYEGRTLMENGIICAEGKRLIWIFSKPEVLSVFNKSKDFNVKDINPFKNHENGLLDQKIIESDNYGLQILDNDDDDVICYNKSGIFIFGLKSKKIIKKYFYRDMKEFLECKRLILPCPNLDVPEEEDKKNMIMELLNAKTHIIEMSDEIIDIAIKNKESEMLSECLKILYEFITDDTMSHLAHFKIYRIFTKYLQRLYLEFPIHYSKLLSNTSIIPNPYKDESYLSKEMKLVGSSDHANFVKIYRVDAKQYFLNFLKLITIQAYFKLNIVVQNVFNQILRFLNITEYQDKRVVSFVIPYLGFTKYPPKYNFWMELLRPKDNLFVNLDDQTFYDSWNVEALLNFKWNTFGKYYYRLMWGGFTVFLLSFGVASTLPSSAITDTLLHISIILGSFHIFHEFRQFVWDWKAYITDLWNLFDLAAYIFPVYTAIFWLYREKPQLPLISISNLFLHFKFITFLRALDYFGSNFTIIVGVARRIFSFLLILFLILIGFAHAFYIILTPNEIYDMNRPVMNDDPNNPWNLVDKYQSVSPDGSEIVYSKLPDSNVNQFATYKTSLLAMYLFLTGDSSALGAWTYLENPFMTILLTMFSCLIVVYLMNLFIGLLNLEIEKNKTHCLFMLRKAKVLVEIELFLLLPNQRRWSHWFPDLLFYDMPIEKVREKITEIDNSLSDYQPHISDKLRKLAEMKKDSEKSISDNKVLVESCEVLLKRFEKLEAKIESLLEKNHTAIDIFNE